MKLISEMVDDEQIEFITEEKNGEKSHFIKGVFMQAEQKNRNGRIYPKRTLGEQVNKYVTNYVDQNRAFGELGHPDGPVVNLERVSHMIKELREDGNNWIGKAKIMDTPYGKIVKNLIDEGAKLGVSSRGMGSLKSVNGTNIVQDDFYLATAADIVADPSAPEAFVEGVMEGREWVWDNGVIREQEIARMKQRLQQTNRKKLEEAKLNLFKSFLSKL
tara:strand:- start:1317 stop:1967 length:651 start_codon:yes stop_codon:yes gene_type:complete